MMLAGRMAGQFLRQNGDLISNGFIYAHMDYRYLPGDLQFFHRSGHSKECDLAIEVFDDASNAVHTAEKMRHSANYWRRCSPPDVGSPQLRKDPHNYVHHLIKPSFPV
ncbi:hypothetical protein CYMTET_25655 [Cymbomonas tetramitiformis]|uniref:Uncharacterized protein n=1 Tax=Cymbomonas tetramitiformis TaxID=36881 RepID=A0AAE0KYZ1_9CHLO|nr:hypothetical protein CYMTET_25655 [Cymbomonas tetramitiformis]